MKQELSTPYLTADERLILHQKLWELLQTQVKKYTSGESSSLPKELAEEILTSICYTLGIDSASSDELKAILDKDFIKLHHEKLGEIEDKIRRCKRLWQAACMTMPEIENISMMSTLKSIGTFWDKYNYDFFAGEITCDIDYQLCHPVSEKLMGVDYVNRWLMNILIENEFIGCFDNKRCITLLKNYCRDYKDLLINLYSPIVTNALGLTLVNGDALSLDIGCEERSKIKQMFVSSSRQQAERELENAALLLADFLDITNPDSIAYLRKTACELLPRINAAIPHNDLEYIFLQFR